MSGVSSDSTQLFIRLQLSARPLRDQTHRERVYRPLQFHERSQHFIGVHHETPSVIAMRVCNEDRASRGSAGA